MVFVVQGKKNKKLFWVPAIAPLISVVLSTFFVYITHAEKKGVQIVSSFPFDSPSFLTRRYHSSPSFCFLIRLDQVKHIEEGINPPSVSEIYFTGDYLLKGVRIGIVAGIIALTVSFFLCFYIKIKLEFSRNGDMIT